MKFNRGNKAIKNHLNEGKRIFLFVEVKKAYVKYVAELEYEDDGFYIATDRNKNERNAIQFFLRRVGAELDYINRHPLELGDLQKPIMPDVTERQGLVTSRVGQGAYRKRILFRWQFRCAVTNYSNQRILIASHIVPWKGTTSFERLDVGNGILLTPIYDALFDRHLISFENDGSIILSSELTKTDYKSIGVSGKELIKNLSVDNYPYLERHRENLI